MHDNDHITDTSPTRRRPWARAAVGLTAAGVLLLGGATTAFATVAGHAQNSGYSPAIKLVVTNPRPGDIAGAGGDFTVDLIAQAQNARGNNLLSASNGYRPGLNLPPAATFGPGKPDPNAPGLVVTLSTTPKAAGGPNANLAGVFQLNSVSRHHGLIRVINDWEVGVPGFFGKNEPTTLTAYLVRGTAPGIVTGHERPISNVVHETFTIGGATTGTATLTASDGNAFDVFGQSTAISRNGHVAVVGSPLHHGTAGAAYVFTSHGHGFSQSAELTPPKADSGDQLGTSVAISGNGQTVVAGADGANNGTGAAFVFSHRSGSWTRIAKLVAKRSLDAGVSVAISADASTIVVTAPFVNHEAGAAYVFTKSGSTYKQAQKLTLQASGIALLGFDAAVSADGSTIVLGAPLIRNQAGAAEVFTKSGTTWRHTARLIGANTAAGDNFGITVAVSGSGTTVAVGSPSSNGGDGSAYVFTKSGRTFTQASQVLPPAGTSNAGAGQSIGISSDGSVVAIGAGQLNHDAGAVFVATRTKGIFAVTATDTAPNPAPNDELGLVNVSTAVAGNGSAIISGARGRNNQTGAAFVFPVS